MATITITISAANAADFAAAVGWDTGLNGSASNAQAKDWIIREMKRLDRKHKDWLNELAKPPIIEIDPT